MYRTTSPQPERPSNVHVERIFTPWLMNIVFGVALVIGLLASLLCLRFGTRVVCTRAGEARCAIRDVSVLEPTVEGHFQPSRTAVAIRRLGVGRDLSWGLTVAGDRRLYRSGVTESFAREVVDGVGRFASDEAMERWEAHTSRAIPAIALVTFGLLFVAFLLRASWWIVIRVNYDMQRVFVRVGRKLWAFSFDELRAATVRRLHGKNAGIYELHVETNDGSAVLFGGSESMCTRAAALLNAARDART